MTRRSLAAAIAAAFALGARAQTDAVPGASKAETSTPLQRALSTLIAERQAAGLPVPASVEYTYQTVDGASAAAASPSLAAAPSDRTVTIVGRAVLRFDNPEQAGYAGQWPRLEVLNDPGATIPLPAGDYTEVYRAAAEAQAPGIWEQYEFGREPRTYRLVETITYTYPAETDESTAVAKALALPSIPSGATLEQILLGFTYTGPNIKYIIETDASFGGCVHIPWPIDEDICVEIELYYFKAGFELSWALGLRLPGEVSLSGPETLASGSDARFTTFVSPLNWAPDDYERAGVSTEGGNEFVLRETFFLGIEVRVASVDLCEAAGITCNLQSDVDGSASFATPLGNAPIDLPAPRVPLFERGLGDALSFSAGFQLEPHLGGGSIQAAAGVAPGGAASGGGALTYAQPGQPYPVDVNACITPGSNRDVLFELSGFRYWFGEFQVKLQLFVDLTVAGYTPDIGSPYTLTTFDLSGLSQNLSLGRHVACDWDFHCSPVGPDDVVAVGAHVEDMTPPETTLTVAGDAGKEGWYRSDLTLTLGATDYPLNCASGVAETWYSLAGVTARYAAEAPPKLATEGIFPFLYWSIDADQKGEEAKTAELKIDKTPPSIQVAETMEKPNDHGWYGHDVVVNFTVSDALSGIDEVLPSASQTLSTEGAGQAATATAWDHARNSASATASGISIDKTPPLLELLSPPAGTYPNTATLVVAWTASDPAPAPGIAPSGIAHEGGALLYGGAAEGAPVENGGALDVLLLAPGSYVVDVEVTDRADHATSADVQLTVTVDLDGLLAAQRHACELDWINKLGICNSLEVKLLAAQASRARSDLGAAANELGAFLNELDAQWNKAINPGAYELLRADVQYVLARLGG